MSKTILVGCKLPCGMVLDGLRGQNSVELNGANSTYVPGAPGLTHVDEDEWSYLSAAYASHPAFVNQSIYAHGTDSVADALAIAEELKDETTGFEGIDPHKPDAGLEPMDAAKLDHALQENTGAAPRKKLEGADRAAALEATSVKGGKPSAAKGKVK